MTRNRITETIALVFITAILAYLWWSVSGCTANIFLGGTHHHAPPTPTTQPTWEFGLP